jgi:hypothetical protein
MEKKRENIKIHIKEVRRRLVSSDSGLGPEMGSLDTNESSGCVKRR